MMAAFGRLAAILALAIWLAPFHAIAQSANSGPAHLGVASCSGSNCHGATERVPGSSVPNNEFIIWSKRDKHRQAYTVLLEDRAIRMARALGLPDAANQKICLDCHADNVPPEQRGRQFQIADGVGCEACHGGAQNWLGTHISGANHQQNVAAGMYPTEQPAARAEKCLSCHFGDSSKFVDHRLYGAGHPRLRFELDTFTAIQPAHFVVDQDYVRRKGRVTDVQVWATGQAVSLVNRINALLDPKRGHHGVFPELALYDCQGCHHPYGPVAMPTASGLGPGTVKLYDANSVMLEAAASRIAPPLARAVNASTVALHRATDGDPAAVPRMASALRQNARAFMSSVASREMGPEEIRALADAVIARGNGPDEWRVSHAEQTAMALQALATALRSAGAIDTAKDQALTKALEVLVGSFPNEATFRPEAFQAALRDFQRAIR